jgi:MFS family permease
MGDRVGRKSTLVATLLLMGVSTLLIGFLPVYAEIGAAAPVLLVVLRFVQGLGVGGEWGGAVLMALEHGHGGRRGFYASWPQAGVPLGLLLSTGVVFLCRSFLGVEAFEAWGWRIPFYLSGLLIVVGLLIRLHIMETPLFAALLEQKQVSHSPIRETLRGHGREILLAAGTRLSENACFYLFAVWVLAYAREALGGSEGIVMVAVNVAAAVEFFTIPLFGLWSDRWSRRGVYLVGCLFLIAFAGPYCWLLNTGSAAGIFAAVLLSLAGGHAMLYSVQAALIPELFGTRVRCTGASLGYQLAAPFAGGLAPLIAAALLKFSGGDTWPLAAYIVLLNVISIACVLCLAETSRKQLGEAVGHVNNPSLLGERGA